MICPPSKYFKRPRHRLKGNSRASQHSPLLVFSPMRYVSIISRTRGLFFFTAPATDSGMLTTAYRIQELRLYAYLSGNIMPPTPLPSEIPSLDNAPTQVIHPFYANDSAATAFARPSIGPDAPDAYMSITASLKFDKHSFEVYLPIFDVFRADALISTLGTTASISSCWQGAYLIRNFLSWVATVGDKRWFW